MHSEGTTTTARQGSFIERYLSTYAREYRDVSHENKKTEGTRPSVQLPYTSLSILFHYYEREEDREFKDSLRDT